SPDATQSFTLTVSPGTAAPVITSPSAASFTEGTQGSFSVTTTGSPAAAISEAGALPPGARFASNGDGTATPPGTPAAGPAGSPAGTASQSFLLTVNSGLAITSDAAATATVGSAFSFTVKAVGAPAPALTRAGSLPSGVTFTSNRDGTATLAGAPTAAGSFP